MTHQQAIELLKIGNALVVCVSQLCGLVCALIVSIAWSKII
jgi:hypothetical protein